MALTIRRLRPGDEAAACAVANAFKAVRISAAHAAGFLENQANYLIVAESGESLAGFVLAYRLDRLDRATAQFSVYEVSVAPPHQRKKVGTALMEFVRALVRKRGWMEAFVLAHQSNVLAIRLYRRTGAQVEDDASLLFVYPGSTVL